MLNAYRIRPAELRDADEIVRLVRELAAFEDLPGPDRDGAARLVEHGFGPKRHFEVLLAESDDRVFGFALYFLTYSTFAAKPSLYVEDLFVRPPFRRLGVATALLRRLAAEAVTRNCGRFEWTVLDWNQNAQTFYRSLGAQVLPDWRICRIDRHKALVALAADARPDATEHSSP